MKAGEVGAIEEGVAHVVGMGEVAQGELVAIGEARGVVVAIGETSDVALLDSESSGGEATRLDRALTTPAGDLLRGRIVDPIGRPLDGERAIEAPLRPLFAPPPRRTALDFHRGEPLFTGLKRIDLFARIRRGDRRALYAPSRAVGAAIGIEAMLHQADGDVACVYAAVDRPIAELRALVARFEALHARDRITVVGTGADATAAARSLVPFAACAVAEAFRDAGKDAFLVIDDLGSFARAAATSPIVRGRWRPGEAISSILDRAVLMQRDHGGGSLTALVVAEAPFFDGDAIRELDAAIDGSFVVSDDPLAPRATPTIDVARSTPVQRFGAPLKGWGSHLHARLRSAREASADDPLVAAFDQPHGARLPVEEQVVSVYAALQGYAAGVPAEAYASFEDALLADLRAKVPDVLAAIREVGGCSGDVRAALDRALASFRASRPRA